MAELIFASGFDAWVLENHPDANRSGTDAVRLEASERKGVVQIPVTGLRGKTVVSATLFGHVSSHGAGWVAQTVTAKMLASGINPSKVTWDNLPSTVAGISCSVTTGALAAGASVAIDVTDIAQAIADGQKWHGFLLTTDAAAVNTANFRSFTSGQVSWSLVIEISDAPDQPTDLRPNDGNVGSGAPIVAWDGGTMAWVAIQVQADPDADAVSPAFDSGTVASSDPQLDLTATAFTPLASGDSTQWRARAQNTDGAWSPWSDWASFGFTPDRVLVMDSPTGGVIGDPTFSVLAHLATGTLRQYRIRIAKGTDRTDIRYDTGHLPPDGGTIAHDIPWRDPDTRRRIIKGDDTHWQLNVRAWTDDDRVDAVGDPTYVETWVDLVFDDDVTEPPADYTITPAIPGSPQLVHSWTRSEAADKWVIRTSAGELVHTLTPDDVTVDAGTYTFIDRGETQPYVATTYDVRAIDAGTRSVHSNLVTVTPRPIDFWIIPDDGSDPIQLRGNVIDGFTKRDRRDTYQPVNVHTDVDIVYGYEGVSGSFEGRFDTNNPTTGPTGGDVLAAVARLEDLRRTPTARPRLVWASQSIRAQLKNLSPLPSSLFNGDQLKHHVTFDFIQAGD